MAVGATIYIILNHLCILGRYILLFRLRGCVTFALLFGCTYNGRTYFLLSSTRLCFPGNAV